MSILSPQAYPTVSSRSAYTYAKVKRADEARLVGSQRSRNQRSVSSTRLEHREKGKMSPLGKLLGSADDEAKHQFKQQDWWYVHRGLYHH